jgi:hypothetical protein
VRFQKNGGRGVRQLLRKMQYCQYLLAFCSSSPTSRPMSLIGFRSGVKFWGQRRSGTSALKLIADSSQTLRDFRFVPFADKRARPQDSTILSPLCRRGQDIKLAGPVVAPSFIWDNDTGRAATMTRTLVALCALTVGLSACADYKAKLAAHQQAAEDDAKCQSSGSKPDEPAYLQCRAQLDAARTTAGAIANSGPEPPPVKRVEPWQARTQSMPPIAPVMPPPR